ncbi:unnamed protein product [Anisakis simplex]|uniref:Glycosyltransferase family 92 protein n=1 Tax=Anisakis simplex TaxID=6269 RepID=A0A0M3IZY3_ANISI|nr:unnamed protein product [Anisakis simplex]
MTIIPMMRVSTTTKLSESVSVSIEAPFRDGIERRHELVVCMAPMYTYTDWQIMLLGIENWLYLGATKIVIPIQSASTNTLTILKEYERAGIVILRHWPKWPILSDVNPNGLVLSRGIEESHVNCLFFVKPWADMVVFTDLDDMLIPVNPMNVQPRANIQILQRIMREHPQAGSLLFEQADVQLKLPKEEDHSELRNFNFDFLRETKWKKNCALARMKTRVAVNASRVDSVNMHETGIHRFGYVQVRVPCHMAHFYHLRHSYRDVEHGARIDMNNLVDNLNRAFENRLQTVLAKIASEKLNKSSTESFADFDDCVIAINREHMRLRVSRCMTPHVCYSRLNRDMDCVASEGEFEFVHSDGDFVIVLTNARYTRAERNCIAPNSKFTKGDYFYLP